MAINHNVITAWLAQWEHHFVEPIVFKTTDPQQIAYLINNFCQKELGVAVAEYLFYEASQGAVCGVRLTDERRIVIKVHQPSRSLAFLQAVGTVQHYLSERGYPCTKPLLDPQPLAYGTATVEELIDEGVYLDEGDPALCRSMAHMLARLIKLTWIPADIPGLQPTALDMRLSDGVIWPTPHSKLFDFEATTKGAEWIDEIARQAQATKLHGAGRLVLGHTDWRGRHIRYVGEHVRIIYDWDSLALEKEPAIVGHASVNTNYTAFCNEYELTRGKPFTTGEQQTLRAARIYELAYGARCEHALQPNAITYPEGSYRSLLLPYR